MKTISVKAHIYQQAGADFSLGVPAESFGGWLEIPTEIPLENSALISMHAERFYDPETGKDVNPGVEYLSRADMIVKNIFPPLLKAARGAGMPIIHVGGGGDYYKNLSGFLHTLELCPDDREARPFWKEAPCLDLRKKIAEIKNKYCPTKPIEEFSPSGKIQSDFFAEARPLDSEYIVKTTQQLDRVCRKMKICHLIYIGFAINWCLDLSPAGMIEIRKRGSYVCSTIREATTAVENKESVHGEWHKEQALWRVARRFGLVFDCKSLVNGLKVLRND